MRIFFLIFLLSVNLLAFNKDFKTFKSDFTQLVESINSSIKYQGSFVLTPSKAFWLYENPSKKQIYINEKEVVIVEEDLEQVIYTRLEKLPNLSLIFQNAKKKDDGYETLYEGVLYKIRLKDDEISEVSYKDDFDNIVTISLHNQQRDTKIDEDIFKPKIPSSYDILK